MKDQFSDDIKFVVTFFIMLFLSIALVIGFVYVASAQMVGGDDVINIVSQKDIQNGKEFLITAVDQSGNKVGFSPDGSVEIEKVRIINPPRYKVVPVGTVGAIKHSGIDVLTGKQKEWWVLDDPDAALMQALRDTEKIISRGSGNVQFGKIGTTVTTIYASVTGADGIAGINAQGNLSWTNLRNGNGDYGDATIATGWVHISCQAGSTFDQTYISVLTFADLSTYVAGNTVVSSTLSVKGSGANTAAPWGANVVGITPGSQTTIVQGDYQLRQRNIFSTQILNSAWLTTGYNNFAFNATGTAYVQAGNESFALTSDYDTNNVMPTCSAGQQGNNLFKMAETAGSTEDPFITIETTVSGGGSNATSSVSLGDVLAPLGVIDLIIDSLALIVAIGGVWYIKRYGNHS